MGEQSGFEARSEIPGQEMGMGRSRLGAVSLKLGKAAAILVLCSAIASCGSGGSSSSSAFGAYTSSLLQPPIFSGSPGSIGYISITPDGRAFGGSGYAIVNTAPDLGAVSSSRVFYDFGGDGAAINAENASGNIVASSTQRLVVYYADSIDAPEANFIQVGPGNSYQSVLAISARRELLAVADGPNYKFDLLYFSSPTATPMTIASATTYTSVRPFTGSIDNQDRIVLFTDHLVYLSSPTATPVDFQDSSGNTITATYLTSLSGEVVIQSSPPQFFTAGTSSGPHAVNLGGAVQGYVKFINSAGAACGYFIDTNNVKHACLWSSLDKAPTDLSNATPSTQLTSIDYVFDSGTLIGSNASGVQYRLTPNKT